MLNFIKRFEQMRFDKAGMKILWSEAVLFSVVFGIAYRSALVPIILFFILFTFLRSPKRNIYAVVLLSFLWGLIFAALAFDAGGWLWALALGGFVFYKGVRIHLRDLKQEDAFMSSLPAIDLPQNWNFGRQNLN